MSWLPTEVTPPAFDPAALRILLFGRPKIGKSTWAASFPDALFLCPEEGHKHLAVNRISIDSWGDKAKPTADGSGVQHASFLSTLEELENNRADLPYKTFVIDTADRLFKACFDHVCAVNQITHPQDLKYGKGWDALSNEFRRGVTRLTKLGRGVIFISHTKTRMVTIGEGEVEKNEVSMPNGAQSVIVPEVDLILRADYATDEATGNTHRVLVAAGTEHNAAGSRWSLPPMFPLTIRGGYDKLLSYLRGKEIPKVSKALKISNIKIPKSK